MRGGSHVNALAKFFSKVLHFVCKCRSFTLPSLDVFCLSLAFVLCERWKILPAMF